ncbi:MAG: hypothetical protein JWP20_1711, partial [Roseomonas sp.]|nr:hypothetical protein [Roseomonas sp.]
MPDATPRSSSSSPGIAPGIGSGRAKVVPPVMPDMRSLTTLAGAVVVI